LRLCSPPKIPADDNRATDLPLSNTARERPCENCRLTHQEL